MVIGFKIGAASKKVMASGTAIPRTTSPRANRTLPHSQTGSMPPRRDSAARRRTGVLGSMPKRHPLRQPELHRHREPNTKHHKRERLDQHANRQSDEILHSIAERNLTRCSESDREQ